MEIRAISFFTQLPAHPSLQQMRQKFAPIGQKAAQVQREVVPLQKKIGVQDVASTGAEVKSN